MKNVRMLLFLMILGSICTILLGSANFAFEKASNVFSRRLYKVILEKFEIPAKEHKIEEKFAENFDVKKVGHTTYYISKTQDKNQCVYEERRFPIFSRIGFFWLMGVLFGFNVASYSDLPF